MTRARGFTLIELLVVIAIIAILAAILFPVFAQAKLAAKKTVALSNAKQIATANFIYMGDYDDALIKEFYGFPGDCQSWGSTYYNWRYALQPYVAKSNGLLADPTNPFNTPQYYQKAWWDGTTIISLPANFATNNAIIGFANGTCVGDDTPAGLDSLSSVDDPAGTIVMVPNRSQWNDLKWFFGSPSWSGGTPGWCMLIAPAFTSQACPAAGNGPIHAVGKAVSWVWADGHAKSRPYSQTLNGSSATVDDWGASKYTKNHATGKPYTQADRQAVLADLYAEYK